MGDEVVMALTEAESIPICQLENWKMGSRTPGPLAWQSFRHVFWTGGISELELARQSHPAQE